MPLAFGLNLFDGKWNSYSILFYFEFFSILHRTTSARMWDARKGKLFNCGSLDPGWSKQIMVKEFLYAKTYRYS
jgi:hypothetical protein